MSDEVVTLESDIQKMFFTQDWLQRTVMGHDTDKMTTQERVDYIHWNTTAAVDEFHEGLGATSWKPWTKGTYLKAEEVIAEMVDAWHFMMNNVLAAGSELGLDAAEVAALFREKYFNKARVNAARQQVGYDGQLTKCPACRDEISETNDMSRLIDFYETYKDSEGAPLYQLRCCYLNDENRYPTIGWDAVEALVAVHRRKNFVVLMGGDTDS